MFPRSAASPLGRPQPGQSAIPPAVAAPLVQDSALPGLSLLLSRADLAERLCLDDLQLTYLRYKPGTSCLAGFVGSCGPQQLPFAARVTSPRDWRRRRTVHLQSVTRRFGRRRFGLPLVIDDAQLTVAPFPFDASLRAVARLMDEGSRERLLQRVFSSQDRFEHPRVLCLAHKPQRRFVAQVAFERGSSAVLKFYTRDGFQRAQAVSRALRNADVPGLPRQIGRSRRHGILALDWVPGCDLSDSIDTPAHVALAAAALARLHRSSCEGLPRDAWQTAAADATDLAAFVGGLVPDVASMAARLAEQVGQVLQNTADHHCLVHGDFNPTQVIVGREAVSFIDMDRATTGDPAADIGSFLARLEYARLAGQLSEAHCGRIAEDLLSEYQQHAPAEFRPTRVDAQTGVALFRLAADPFRCQTPDWPARTANLLQRAEQLLRPRAVVAGPRVRQRPCIPQADRLSAANELLDRTTASEALSALWPDEDRMTVEDVALVRIRPNRRCLLRFRLAWPDGRRCAVLGKVRAKGADRRSFAIQQRLADCAFSPTSADGLSVPAVAGLVPDRNMWCQYEVDGVNAETQLLSGGTAATALAERCAAAVFKLHHSADIVPDRQHSIADELRILDQRLQQAGPARPSLAPRLRAVAVACHQLARRLPPATARPIHRDFYPEQIVVDDGRLYLLDFDLCCLGDPLLDVGNFVAHLLELGLRFHGSTQPLEPLVTHFSRHYQRLQGDNSQAAIDVWTLLALARHIQISIRISDRNRLTESVLEEVERRLRGVGLLPPATAGFSDSQCLPGASS